MWTFSMAGNTDSNLATIFVGHNTNQHWTWLWEASHGVRCLLVASTQGCYPRNINKLEGWPKERRDQIPASHCVRSNNLKFSLMAPGSAVSSQSKSWESRWPQNGPRRASLEELYAAMPGGQLDLVMVWQTPHSHPIQATGLSCWARSGSLVSHFLSDILTAQVETSWGPNSWSLARQIIKLSDATCILHFIWKAFQVFFFFLECEHLATRCQSPLSELRWQFSLGVI